VRWGSRDNEAALTATHPRIGEREVAPELSSGQIRPSFSRYCSRQLSSLNPPNMRLGNSERTADAHCKSWMPHAAPPSGGAADAGPTREVGGGNELHLVFHLLMQALNSLDFVKMRDRIPATPRRGEV
jgi:hypothetical protein